MIFSGFKGTKKTPFTERVYDKILSVDGFGFPVQLLLKKSDQQQTFVGGFFTVGLMTLCFVYFYQMMDEMISRSAPTVLTNTLFNQAPKRVELGINNFFFAFAIQNELTFAEYQNQSLFDVSIKQCVKNYSDFKCQILPTEPCNFMKHIELESIKDFFMNKPMSDYYCLNSEYWKQAPPYLQGTFDNDHYGWISFQVSRCKNKTGSNIVYLNQVFSCASDEEIDFKLNGGFFEIFISDSISNFLNPETPYSQIARTIYDSFSIQTTKEYNMYFRQLQTQSDYGYIMESLETTEALAYSTFQSLIMNKKSDSFLNVVLRLETKLDITKRQYYKVQDICGIIGGFWQSIAIFGILLISPINKLQYQIRLLNSLFTFELEEEETFNEQLNRSPQEPESTPFSQRIDVIQSSRLNTLRELSKQKSKITAYQVFRDYIDQRVGNRKGRRRRNTGEDFKNLIKQNVGKLKLTTLEYLGFFTNCLEKYRAKQNQIDFALKKLEKDIDLIQILKRLIEVEKLKMLLLSEDQLKLFEYLPRPCIPLEVEPGDIEQKYLDILSASADKKMQFWQMLHKRKTLKQRAFEAYESYDKILRQGRQSDIDQKLIQFLDPNIRQLFELYYEQNQKSSCNVQIQKIGDIKADDNLNQSSMADQVNEKDIDEKSNIQERDKYLAMSSQRSKIFDGN